MPVLIKLEVVAADHEAARAAVAHIESSLRTATDAAPFRAEFYDLARHSANPASPPYEVVDLKRRE